MRHILLAVTALVLLSGSAYAQRATSNSGASANVSNASTSRSSSRTVTNVYTGTAGAGDPSGDPPSGSSGSSGGGDPTINYTGGYTVRNTPDVYAPSVVGGNPCSVGASGGVGSAGFGISFGATWADKQCERRQAAALLYNMGEHPGAMAVMCQDDHVRDAMKVIGRPCQVDLPPVPVAAVAPAQPVVIATTQVPAAPKPDWCKRAAPTTDASKAYVAQMCGK